MVRRLRGFTLIELMIVLAILAGLLTYVGVRTIQKVDVAKEQALRHNLTSLRDALDQFQADRGQAPDTLTDLVDRGYLRQLPVDPFTERADSWQTVIGSANEGDSGIIDVHSGSGEVARDGSQVASW